MRTKFIEITPLDWFISNKSKCHPSITNKRFCDHNGNIAHYTPPANTFTNYQYVELMKETESSPMNQQTVSFAFNHYKKINETKNHYSINKVLKIACIGHQSVTTQQILNIWQHITSISCKDLPQSIQKEESIHHRHEPMH
eukprot:342094_1